jgi:transcriptional regulator with XRE-family HTH domain
MAAVHEDPPAVARQRVRRALRKAREATPWSQGEVARRLGWSLSKVQRIEGGEVAVSPTDLRALLDVYRVSDRDLIDRLVSDARTSRRQRYLMAPEYRQHLTQGLLELMQFERKATAIRTYQPVFYPGVVQTPAVAEAILSFWKNSLSEEARHIRHDVRMSRRRQVFESGDGPEYLLILDESVIKRRVHNAEVTAEQLEDLAELAQRPDVHVRLVPLTRGAYMQTLGAFQILSLAGDDDEAVLYREAFLRDEIIHDRAEVIFHREAFENLWDEALSEDATRRAIVDEAALLRSSLDGHGTR